MRKGEWKDTAPKYFDERGAQGRSIPKSRSQIAKEAAHAYIGRSSKRGPVSWPLLGLAAVAAATGVSYYTIERERRLEKAMGTVVSSESGSDNSTRWSPGDGWAPRKFKLTQWGWFPEDHANTIRECVIVEVVLFCCVCISLGSSSGSSDVSATYDFWRR